MISAMISNEILEYAPTDKYLSPVSMKKSQLMHFDISNGSYNLFLDNIVSLIRQNISAYVCIANVHMFVEAHLSPLFANVISRAQIVTPDGMPLTWALARLYGIKQKRVAGMDLLPDLLRIAVREQMPIFIYGGTNDLLFKAESYLQKNYPRLPLKGMYSPPFRKMTEDEDNEIVNKINSSGARIVLVCLGCPKQEKWMASMHGRINAIMIGIGGALPVLVGVKKRAPEWMQKRGLEWLFRLYQEPFRLFGRYAQTNSLFIYLMIREWIRIKLLGKK